MDALCLIGDEFQPRTLGIEDLAATDREPQLRSGPGAQGVVDADECRPGINVGENPRNAPSLGVECNSEPPGNTASAEILQRAALSEHLDTNAFRSRKGFNVVVEVEIFVRRAVKPR